MTTNKLDEIEGRLKAATPGPWVRNGSRARLRDEDCITVGPQTFWMIASPIGHTDKQHGEAFRDMEFVAHCPEDIAYLISRVRELEEANDSIRQSVVKQVAQYDTLKAERDRLRAILDAPVTEEDWNKFVEGEVEKEPLDKPIYWGKPVFRALQTFLAARRTK